jgi:low temperature requirement protein LtrA
MYLLYKGNCCSLVVVSIILWLMYLTQQNRANHISHQQAHTEGTNINQNTMTSTTKEQQFPL